MGRLLSLFIFGFIGLSLRFIILGEFELNQLLLLLLFPIVSIAMLFIMKWQYNKDRDYEPDKNERYFVTRLGDRVSTTKKQIYSGKNHIGTYHRTYNRWWKRVVADVMDTPGSWYLNLSFALSNGDQITLKGKNENKIRGNNEWIIVRNDKDVGKIRTDYSFKNVRKLKESLYLDFGGKTYHYKSLSIKPKTEISVDNTTIATGERIGGSVYELNVNNLQKDKSEMLFMVYVLFNYQFGQ